MNSQNDRKKNDFKILVDQKPFDWPEQFITGIQIKELAGTDMSYGVWLKINGPGEDAPIGDDEQFDLSQPGREHFFTGPTQTTEG